MARAKTASQPPPTAPLAERLAFGKRLRRKTPRSAHAEWKAPAGRTDPVATLIDQGRNRIAALMPLRYARMAADPFAFMRGAAAVMAADLVHTPAAGLRVQCCGDAHLANFGAFATPEGQPAFDVNDFDETLPAPFEWDVKRLAASLAVAALTAGHADKRGRALARLAARSYREHIAGLAALGAVEAWGRRIDLEQAISGIDKPRLRRSLEDRLAKVMAGAARHFDLLAPGGDRLVARQPLTWRLDAEALPAEAALAAYANSLEEDRQVLLARYRLRDVVFKVVGVGSVGTFCAIALMTGGDGSPLLLQIKEAQDSVLAPHTGASTYANPGQRVVTGQRMMQAASDIFLGWTGRPVDGRRFYVRRLKDSRLADIGAELEALLPFYAGLCGRTLARAHARAGDAAVVAGYLGSGEAFDAAIGEFAAAYARQGHVDWQALVAAIAAGRVKAEAR